MTSMKASLLTVGTEITSGQIVNENAKVLSQNLQRLGVETVIHISVPDDRHLILEALSTCAAKSELLFVTGGLGPTSDDFTRDLINIWSGNHPLEFHEPSWEKVQKRLNERGLVAHEFQKQQCYYPKGSMVLENSQGTANGFYLHTNNKHLWALPGPPNEIEALWNDHVHKQIKKFPLDPKITKSWDVIGLGENQVAHSVEPYLIGFQGDIGYRVHQPYVEFKLSFFESNTHLAQPYIDQIEKLLEHSTVARDGEDVSLNFCKLILAAPHMTIIDEVTDGRWLMQLTPHMKTLLSKCNFTYSKKYIHSLPGWSAHLMWIDDNNCELKLQRNEKIEKFLISTPLLSPALKERKKLYFAEMAMLKIVQSWSKI